MAYPDADLVNKTLESKTETSVCTDNKCVESCLDARKAGPCYAIKKNRYIRAIRSNSNVLPASGYLAECFCANFVVVETEIPTTISVNLE